MSKQIYFKNVYKSSELCPIIENNMVIYIEEFLNRINDILKEKNLDQRILTKEQIYKYKQTYLENVYNDKIKKKKKEQLRKQRELDRTKKINENAIKSKELQQELKDSEMNILISENSKI